MTDGMYIDPQSLRNLRTNFRAFSREVLAASLEGLKDFGLRIIAQAKANLKANDSVASGLLRNSGRTVVQPDNTVDAGFYTRYAEYVEYGRPPGKMPPVDVLEQYIRRKGRRRNSALKAAAVFSGKSEEELARSAAWGMAKSIAEKGTRPHPFLKPAYDQYRIRIAQFMQGKVNATCDKYKTK